MDSDVQNPFQKKQFLYSAIVCGVCLGLYLALPVAVPAFQRVLGWSDTNAADSGVRYHKVPILLFHDLDAPGPYAVSRHEFRRYMEAIRDSGIRVISLKQLYEQARNNQLMSEPSIVITIDDDFKNIVRVAAPILREFHYPATIFIYTQGISKYPRFGMSWEDLRRLREEGFEIQNHSWSHSKFHVPRKGESREGYLRRVEKEIVQSREVLKKNLPGLDAYAFAYPMGYYSDFLRDRLFEEGYRLLVTTDAHPVDLTEPFTGTFHRYTIQKFFVKDPEEMFQRQLYYAKLRYHPRDQNRAARDAEANVVREFKPSTPDG